MNMVVKHRGENYMATETIISPAGTIVFAALDSARTQDSKYLAAGQEPKAFYELVLEFKNSETAWKNTIKSINPKLISQTENGFKVRAKTQYQVEVLNSTGEVLGEAEIPQFRKGSTGTAIMEVRPHGESGRGGLNLVRVKLGELTLVEGPSH